MAMTLGKDGKERAMASLTGASTSAVSTVYIGMLDTLPAGYDGLDAATLLANEASITNFYIPSTGRSSISFGSVTAGSAGASITNNSSASWVNNSGGSVLIEGLFLTDASAGTSGEILWVGSPNIAATFATGATMKIAVGDLRLQVD